jgi:hypothetical protein
MLSFSPLRWCRLCLTRAESTPTEGTGQAGTTVGWLVRTDGCGGWRRVDGGAVRLASRRTRQARSIKHDGNFCANLLCARP